MRGTRIEPRKNLTNGRPSAGLSRRVLLRGALSFGVLLSLPSVVEGQGYRGELTVGGSYLEMRPVARDSLPESEVPGEGVRRRLEDGTVVTCTPGGFCRWYRAADVQSVWLANQDLTVTGWGGVQGLSGHLHVVGRLGMDDFWPLSSQEVALSTAYLSLDRDKYRLRVGRMYRSDGLGFYNFDGASAMWRGFEPVWIEVYGGRSLLRGANETITGSLMEEVEPLAPDAPGLVLGAEVGGRLGHLLSGRVTYQRVVQDDWAALYSERMTLDARALLGPATVDLSAEYDWSFQEFNEARLRVQAELPRNFEATVEARHYTPFFELWSIWGAFSPVGFNELRGSLAWSKPRLGLRLEAGGGYRDYEETNTGSTVAPLRTDGWRLFGSAGWRDRRGWFATGSYAADAGPGASRFGGDVAAGRSFGPDAYVALRGRVTQTYGETRLNEQVIAGGGVDGSLRVGVLTVTGSAALHRVSAEERPQEGGWTQPRLYLGVAYRFGMEPGMDRVTATEGGGP